MKSLAKFQIFCGSGCTVFKWERSARVWIFLWRKMDIPTAISEAYVPRSFLSTFLLLCRKMYDIFWRYQYPIHHRVCQQGQIGNFPLTERCLENKQSYRRNKIYLSSLQLLFLFKFILSCIVSIYNCLFSQIEFQIMKRLHTCTDLHTYFRFIRETMHININNS